MTVCSGRSMRAASSRGFTNDSETESSFGAPWPLIHLSRSRTWVRVVDRVPKSELRRHSDQARMSEGEPESERLDSRFRRKDGKGTFRTNEVRILRSLGVSSEKFTSF